jgi:outer membrane protein TolC
MGPTYEQPKTAPPEAFRMAILDGEAKSIANLPWWDLLQDEELQQLIRIALKENRDLRRAVASIDEFRARALIAKMDFAPQLNATVSTPAFGRKANISFPGFPNPFSYYAQGNLFWEIDVWGRIRRSNEAAPEQREAQAQQVEALRSALRLANLRYKGGLANYLDVLIAQRNLFEAELSFTATHRLHLVSIVQLYKALGGGWAHESDANKGVGSG